jgi:hypothetical protein
MLRPLLSCLILAVLALPLSLRAAERGSRVAAILAEEEAQQRQRRGLPGPESKTPYADPQAGPALQATPTYEEETEALREVQQRYKDLRREAAERKRALRRLSGAPTGWVASVHGNLMQSFVYGSTVGGLFMGADIEHALSPKSSLKLSWSGNVSAADSYSYYSYSYSTTPWHAGLQLRAYPLERGLLNGFFAGLGVHYAELLIRDEVSTSSGPPYYTYSYDYYHSYGHAFGVGPVVGYQWIIGRTIAISLEGDFRYHWVHDPSGYGSYYYSYNDGPRTSYNTTSLDFKGGVGWAF